MAQWAEEHGTGLDFIPPGKPTQNSYIERFNRTYREEVLDLYIFSRLSEVRGHGSLAQGVQQGTPP